MKRERKNRRGEREDGGVNEAKKNGEK